MKDILDHRYPMRFFNRPKETIRRTWGIFERLKAATLHNTRKSFTILKSWKRAAQRAQSDGKLLQAAFLYQKAGVQGKAEQLFTGVARSLYQKRKYLRSAVLYQKLGKLSRAAKALEAYLMIHEGDDSAPVARKDFLDCLYQAVEIHLKLDNLKKACQLLLQYRQVHLAASLLARAGHLDQAARIMEKQGAVVQAARIYQKAGQDRKAGRLRAEAAVETGDIPAAAGWYARAGDWVMAAQQYENLQEWEKAADCYRRGGHPGHGARCYLQIPDPEQALVLLTEAREWKKAGQILMDRREYHRAGTLFAKGRLHFRAGDAFLKARQFQQAVHHLQKVPADSPAYYPAILKLCRIFLARKKPELVISKLEKLDLDGCPDACWLDLHYSLGRAYEERLHLQKARSVYQKVAARDSTHRDIRERLNEVSRLSKKYHLIRFRQSDPTLRYRKVNQLGEGGMGMVYQARDLHLNRTVALKILKKGFADPQNSAAIFHREAQAVAALSHPNIVKVFDFGQISDDYFMAMEYLKGKDLFTLLCERGHLAFTPKEVLIIAFHVASGLSYAHREGIVHQDIKPHNIILTADRKLKIMDFGIATILGQESISQQQYSIGSPHYMSPEQILGRGIDHRTDIYSLGITLFQLLTGRPPFEGKDLLQQQMTRQLPSLDPLRPRLPDPLVALINRCTRKNPLHRYRDLHSLMEDLKKIDPGLPRPLGLADLECYRQTASPPGPPPRGKTRDDRFQTRIPRLRQPGSSAPGGENTESLDSNGR